MCLFSLQIDHHCIVLNASYNRYTPQQDTLIDNQTDRQTDKQDLPTSCIVKEGHSIVPCLVLPNMADDIANIVFSGQCSCKWLSSHITVLSNTPVWENEKEEIGLCQFLFTLIARV